MVLLRFKFQDPFSVPGASPRPLIRGSTLTAQRTRRRNKENPYKSVRDEQIRTIHSTFTAIERSMVAGSCLSLRGKAAADMLCRC